GLEHRHVAAEVGGDGGGGGEDAGEAEDVVRPLDRGEAGPEVRGEVVRDRALVETAFVGGVGVAADLRPGRVADRRAVREDAGADAAFEDRHAGGDGEEGEDGEDGRTWTHGRAPSESRGRSGADAADRTPGFSDRG